MHCVGGYSLRGWMRLTNFHQTLLKLMLLFDLASVKTGLCGVTKEKLSDIGIKVFILKECVAIR